MKRTSLAAHLARAALGLIAASSIASAAQAQEQSPQPQATASDALPVTVVTVYSEERRAPGSARSDDTPSTPPIQIVDGGVKSTGDTCWKLGDDGRITTVPGDCYILRSAAPGERPPTH